MGGLNRVLVANRGEIALRIIRGCQEEGIEAVAVYSEVDRTSPHVMAADAAVEIGPAQASQSYLSIEKLLEAARSTNSDSIHPGYGFLAERAEFADAVESAGLVFIGPPASAIAAMGDKTEARRRMTDAGVPVIPGTVEPAANAAEAVSAAEDLGFPVLLKAAAGGGGKGMRRCDDAKEAARLFEQASSEAQAAFGDGSVYVEKCIERPRHVEIQVLADSFGKVIHVGERECSVQRRHQKLIEESPSPVVDETLRQEMGQAAVRAAETVGYRGAGTVEFLWVPDGNFYFLEMNTRLQVEHPITELVYGVDLVREQLRIASGEPISVADQPLSPRGHSIECRITAEDIFGGFLPATGTIKYFKAPSGPGVRWDGGVEVGNEIGLFYDSLLGKLIVWGETRERAIQRMQRALREMVIVGLPTSQPFHARVMKEASFLSGDYDIEYIDRIGADLLTPSTDEAELERKALAAALAEDRLRTSAYVSKTGQDGPRESAWLIAARRSGLR